MNKKQAVAPVVVFRLREILAERQITQIEAAEMTGLSKTGITNLANSPAAIRLPTIAKICAGLNVTPADLFSLAPAPGNSKRA